MTDSPASILTPEIIADLKARHIAFFHAHIVSDAAERAWRTNVVAIYDALLGKTLGEIAPADRSLEAFDRLLTSEAVERAIRPVAKQIGDVLLAELAADEGTVGDHVEESTRAKLNQLLERPNLLPERLLREMAEQEAIDEALRAVLYDTLKEFNEKVNPFFAEWGLPALLKKLSPFGLGMGKGIESLRGEFDKRLEPEIRKFLQGMSKKSMRRMIEHVITHGDEPKFVAMRKDLAAWILAQRMADVSRSTDAAALEMGREIVIDIVASELRSGPRRARLRRMLADALSARRDKPLRAILDELGISYQPDLEALAAATWPLMRAALSTPAAQAYFAELVGSFYDAELAALAKPAG